MSSAALERWATDGSASLEPVITSSTSTVATDGTPAAVEKFCTDAIEMPTPEEPAVYVSIDSEHSVTIKGTVQAPVSNVAQPHDVLASEQLDFDLPRIDVAPVEDAMPSHDLPASGGVEVDDVSLSTPATSHHPLADVDDVDLAKGIRSVIKFKWSVNDTYETIVA
ncbi:hypothetical protein HK104_010417 [Borealophlyctis nickersoniae]|nr:hypothetical protein HK104_010417 [Borealophlyctis nickersoniae]